MNVRSNHAPISLRFAAATAFVFISTAAVNAADYNWHLPRGFPEPFVPADNPMSAGKVALGRRLFFETRLSVTGKFSCASCHAPERAFSESRKVAVGATGEALPLNAMALVNVAYNISYGWTKPSVRSLEIQMLEPLLNEHPVEMGMRGREQEVLADLAKDESYRQAFTAAFPENASLTFGNVVKAIAAFERTLISGRSAFDRYVFEADHDALSDAAKRGMDLFFSRETGCANCHSGFNFAGNWRDAQGATGEPNFASNGTSTQPMRVPTLRNIAVTSPYMHDGRFTTLEAVLDHYSRPGKAADEKLHAVKLSGRQRRELMAFLGSLTDIAFIDQFSNNNDALTVQAGH